MNQEFPYLDILHLPHHVSTTRPKMEMRDRAAQFAPFAALTGHEDAIRETARLTDMLLELDDSEKERLSEKLQILLEHRKEEPEVLLTYFEPDLKKAGGAIRSKAGVIRGYDTISREILLRDGMKISIENLLQIQETEHTPEWFPKPENFL